MVKFSLILWNGRLKGRKQEFEEDFHTLQKIDSCFLAACQLNQIPTTPIWFMRQAGRYLPEYRKIREKYDLLTLCKTPDLAAEISLQPVRILKVDAAILFADLLLPFIPMGIEFQFEKDEGPVIKNRIQTAENVRTLRTFNPEDDLNYVLETIRILKNELEEKIPIIGFAGAPFTLATYLIEGGHSRNFIKTQQFMYYEPAAWKALMGKLSQVIISFLKAQLKAGASAVQLFDSWAGVLSPSDYQKFVLPYSSQILQEVSEDGFIIHFSTGTSGMLDLISKAGGDIISFDWRIPLDKAWKIIGYNKGIQGNLNPAALLADPKDLKIEVEEILKRANNRPGHIFNLGHGVFPETSVDQLKRVVEWVKTYRCGP